MMQNVWNSSDMNKLSLPHYHKCTFEWLREFSYMYLTTLRKCYVNFRSRNRNWVVSVYKSVIYIIISLSFLFLSLSWFNYQNWILRMMGVTVLKHLFLLDDGKWLLSKSVMNSNIIKLNYGEDIYTCMYKWTFNFLAKLWSYM